MPSKNKQANFSLQQYFLLLMIIVNLFVWLVRATAIPKLPNSVDETKEDDHTVFLSSTSFLYPKLNPDQQLAVISQQLSTHKGVIGITAANDLYKLTHVTQPVNN